MLKIKPSKPTVEKIKSALAGLAAAEVLDRDADARVREFRSRRDANQQEIERLSAGLSPDDEHGILNLAKAQIRQALFNKPIAELERQSFAAAGAIPVAARAVRAPLATAAREVAEGFRAAALAAMRPVTADANFPPWMAARLPEVTGAENFALRCSAEVENSLSISLDKLAEMVIGGEIPLLPEAKLPTPQFIAMSSTPSLANRPFGQ
jgi:hypothetical protein